MNNPITRIQPAAVWRRGVAAALIAVVVAGCGSAAATPSPSPVGPGPSLQSNPAPTAGGSQTAYPTLAPGDLTIARGNAAPAAPAADRGAAAAAQINDFGFDLLRRLDAKGNLVASPMSIALALGMTRPGAKGLTATEMDKVLHSFGADGQSAEIQALLTELASQNVYLDADGAPIVPPDPAKASPAVELSIADEAFVQKDLKLEDAYLNSLTSSYNAGVALVDYKNATETARKLINGWASDQTRGRIPNILNEGDIDTSTRLVLINAIYLKAAWDNEFDPSKTADRPFTTAAGTPTNVPTMAIDAHFNYAEGTGYRAIDLPYTLDGLSMTVVVPDDMASFIAGLSDAQFRSIVGAESNADVDFQLPKFSLETRVSLVSALSAMGMPTAFDPSAADFSGMTTQEPLYIGNVIHQANIDVVEEGTTAAAVTAVVMAAGAAPAQPRKVTFHVDKPFLYFIHDNRSGAVLFMGRVDDPAAK
jgi:serpin B